LNVEQLYHTPITSENQLPGRRQKYTGARER